LVAHNAAGSDSLTKQVYVSSPTAQYVGGLTEGFETATETSLTPFYATFDTANWIVSNLTGNTTEWTVNTYAAYTGTHSLVMNAYAGTLFKINTPTDFGVGDVDEFMTPSMDLSSDGTAYLSFRYSYATQAYDTANIYEFLTIYYSLDCGANWNTNNPIAKLSGTNLVTAGTVAGNFVPGSQALWRTMNYTLPSYVKTSNVRFKWSFTAGGVGSSAYSNNMFLDDISIGETPLVPMGIEENQLALNSLKVFPNPASESATITYHMSSNQNVDLSVYDMLGNKVMNLVSQYQTEGDYSLNIGKQNLSAGLYFIRLSLDNKASILKKFILMN